MCFFIVISKNNRPHLDLLIFYKNIIFSLSNLTLLKKPYFCALINYGESFKIQFMKFSNKSLLFWLCLVLTSSNPIFAQLSSLPGIDTLFVPQGISSFTTCNAKIYDIGGPTSGYPSGTNSIVTIYPSDTCALLQISGSSYLNYNDKLIFYDGVGIEGTVLGTFSGWYGNIVLFRSNSGPVTIKHQGNSGNSNSSSGFNLTVTCVSGCRAPKIVSYLAEEDAIHLNWSNCASNIVDLEYKSVTESTWNSISNISDSNITLSNLMYLTKYEIRIRTNCNNVYSGWNRFYVSTLCPFAVNLPFYEDFSDSITCFTFSDSNRMYFAVNNYNNEAPYIANPTQNLVLKYNGANYGTNSSGYVITPRINNLETGDQIRYLYYRSTANNQPGHIQIYCNSTPSLTGAVLIQQIPLNSNSVPVVSGSKFFEYSAVVPADTFLYVIFKTVSLMSETHLIDKISIVKGSITCPSPTSLIISNINSNSLTLSWLETGTATDWEIEYAPFGSLPGNETILSNITSNPFQITGLPFGQILGFRVRSLQSGDTSAWSSQKICAPGWVFTQSGTQTITSCQLRYFDNGGPYANHTISGTLIVYPSSPNSKIALTGSYTIGFLSSVEIYSGTSATGVNLFPTLSSTNPIMSHFGPITIIFNQANISSTSAGYDISITCIDSSCWAPLSLNATNILHNEATISWIHYITNKPVQIAYKLISDSTWSYAYQDTTLSLVLTGLLPNSNYQYKIRSICAPGDTSNYTGIQYFSTECISVTSFFEDFDSTPVSSLPTCWGNYKNNTLSQVIDTNSYTTSHCLNMNSNSNYGIILPKISNLGNGTNQLRIKMRPNSNFFHVQVLNIGYIIKINNVDTFISIQNIPLRSNNFYNYYFIPPTGLNANYLAFKGGGISNQSIYIDEIAWEPIPDCTSPISLVSDFHTDHSCDLKWDSYNNSNPLSWEVQYGPSGFIPGNGISQFIQTDSITLNGLSSATEYDFYVRAFCSASDTSVWSNKLSFKTFCSYSELPVEENFEYNFENSSCWTSTYNNFDGNTGFTVVSSGTYPTCTPQSGSKMLQFNSYNITTGGYAVLFSPLIECNGSQILISFYQYKDNGFTATQYVGEGLAIFSNSIPSLNGADSIGFVPRQNSVNNWYLNEFYIPEGIIGPRCFIFKAISKYGNNIFVDNIKIKYLCSSPSNVSVSNILYTEADVTWQADATNNSFILDYKKFTENNWTSIVNLIGNNYHLSNLDQNETYQVRIRALCDTSGMSGNSPVISFTTLQDCSPPSNIQIIDSNLLDTTATLTWTHAFNSNYYEISYKSINDTEWIIDTTSENFYVIYDLIPNHSYQVRVRTICSVETSVLSSNLYFLTKCKKPTDLNVLNSSITSNSAQVFWNNPENISQWNLLYKKNTDTTWINITVTDTFYTITNLIPNSIYLAKIQSTCGDNESPFSESIQFSTLVSGITENHVPDFITIVPNPTYNFIEIKLNNDIYIIESIEIVNSLGDILYKYNNPPQSLIVNLSEFASGIYFVKLNTNFGSFGKKIIKL